MMTYVREAQQYEKKIFYKYIKKCYVFCGGSMACTYVTATCFSLRPIVLPVSLPFDAEYPFPINYTSMYVIIYMHHACLCIQTAAHICVSSFGALLLWFTVARFECLAAELEKSTDIDALVVCVKKQLHLKRYAEEVFNSFRFLVLYAIGVATFGITLCFLMMLVNVPLFVKLQFIGVCVTVLMEIYLYAWPADYLKDMSIEAPQSIYNSTWYEQRLGMQKSLLNVLIYRRPLTLSIACIVPELSLRYYCSYLSNAFSIFTTLRVMITIVCSVKHVSLQTYQNRRDVPYTTAKIIPIHSNYELQRIVEEMIVCIKEAEQYEREIFYKYIKKCYVFCGCSIVCTYVTAVGFSLRPAILPVPFPFDVEYPFPVNYTSVYIIIYMQHVCVCFQSAAQICISSFGGLLLWFTAARFECLAVNLERSTDTDTLIDCVKKQLHLRRYGEEVLNNFRFMVLYAVGVATFALTLCCIMMIVDVPLFVKIQYIGACVTVLTEIYLYTWPADYLMDMSMGIPQSAYNSTWYDRRLEMQKNLLNMLTYQKPLVLSIRCVVPELSLRYYCSYLSNAFSIFTTLRVMIQN
ncbi:uncharacterized protein LOC100646115 [Bombus terrestris]|uniref:Uncharacterized protein LOC100646115 n=1 Tax=Bombus terrestris TaxID=30195 RepID=A0A9C6SD24_BOMTE|nr:uncharacterized protein LOC100646115 [Bombus terrestris]